MVDKFLISEVGVYNENDWTNPRTGERKLIRSLPLLLSNGAESFYVEAIDNLASELKKEELSKDDVVLASLLFTVSRNENNGNVRFFQRITVKWLQRI